MTKRPAATLALLDGVATATAAPAAAEAAPADGAVVPVAEPAPSAAAAAKGRPKAGGPNLSGTQRVAWSRFCKKQNLQNLSDKDMEEIKSAWLLDPSQAKTRILSSQTSSSTKSIGGAEDGWYTSSKVAKKEGLEDGSEALQKLLAGLNRRPSRFAHLADDATWDEYEYVGFDTKKRERSKEVTTTMHQSTDEVAEQDVAEISSCLGGSVATSSRSSGGGGKKPRTSGTPTPKAPKPASAQLTNLLQKTMKHLSDMEALIQKGKEHVATSPWLQSIVTKCEDDWAKIKDASKELSAVVTGDKVEEDELKSWSEKMDGFLVKTASMKLLKQACQVTWERELYNAPNPLLP